MQSKNFRYAFVGLEDIAQIDVLPTFQYATKNSELVAFISDDLEKIIEFAPKYRVAQTWSYDHYDDALASGVFDAVYIAHPNDMNKEFAIKAAAAGIHILCEKPMGITAGYKAMMQAAARRKRGTSKSKHQAGDNHAFLTRQAGPGSLGRSTGA
jgi:predicted dehydrogenase